MHIKFLDLTPPPDLREELDNTYHSIMSSGRYIGGEDVEAFEQEWADYVGAKHCVSCGNGFGALVLAMRAYGIGDGDKVEVPNFTCLPTWAAIAETGAMIKPMTDIETTYVKASIPVHLFGEVYSRMDDLNGEIIIEDAAQAHGSLYRDGTKVGSKNTAAWSFYPTKNLGCYGDGGAVTTQYSLVAQYIRELRNYGGNLLRSGINSRLDSLQAAFLRVKLWHLDEENERRRLRAIKYLNGIHYKTPLIWNWTIDYELTNWHQFVLFLYKHRDGLRQYLLENGIETMIHYPKSPEQYPCFAAYKKDCDSTWTEHVLSLPIGGNLTDEQQEYIISKINEWIEIYAN